MFRIQRYGWKRDKLDRRDNLFRVAKPVALPPKFSLIDSPHMPPVYDQGDLGSCTANAIGCSVDFSLHAQGKAFISPSRLFIYYNERVLENTTDSDSGAEIRDGIKAVNWLGVCPEKLWPYDVKAFTTKPPAEAFTSALLCKALKYQKIPQSHATLANALAINQRPISFGVVVYDSFEDDAVAVSGNVPLPGHGENQIGGHAIDLVGYDDSRGVYEFRNSWGPDWGIKGYGTLPYAYVHDPQLSSDFWQIQLES